MTNAFELIDRRPIESLALELQHFRHPATGAEHYHLATDHDEKVFMVALRTNPQDNSGVAHILEHTVLCGSERYPVRDPFFLMMRRSLNTFMNAFTSSDWTAYPFASENDRDFFNLLDVYLDSVFFSNLDPLDFAQEGHRLAFRDNDPEGELEFRGVVYNEMKGAMSSATARLFQAVTRYVFPNTTYHFNSGGEPQAIPGLSYEDLKRFYQQHYHPSNAVFLTFGRVAPERIQAELQEKVLHRFENPVQPISVPHEQRYLAPIEVTERYPIAATESAQNKDHVVMAWLLGDSTDLQAQLEAHFLSEVLMGNSSSPLRAALETTELSASASPLMGVEDSNREMMFVCGVEGTSAEQAAAVETLILDTLQKVVAEGVPLEDQTAVLHQIELGQREIGGDGMPFGLQLIMSVLPTAVHRGDVHQALDIDEALNHMREQIQDPDYLRQLIGRWLLDNPHRVRLTLAADPQYNERAEQEEKERLRRIAAALDTDQRAAIRDLNEKLEAHQQTEPDLDQLPKVTLDDIPKALKDRTPVRQDDAVTAYAEGTNGLTYLSWLRPLNDLSPEQQRWLPLYSMMLSEVGLGARDYGDVQRWQTRISGGVSAGLSARSAVDDTASVQRYLTVNSKALTHYSSDMNELLQETVTTARFDEGSRLHELLQTLLLRRLQGVTGSGHALAMTAASAVWSTGAAQQHWQSGLSGLAWLKSLVKDEKTSYISDLQAALKALHNELSRQPGHLLAIGEQDWLDQHLTSILGGWGATEPLTASTGSNELPAQSSLTAWITDSPVNYLAQAFPAVPVNHPDAAALAVLAGVLSNGFLHRAVREQGGAYGGGASYDLSNGVFRFYSYRDPRLAETYVDFARSMDWLLEQNLGYQPVEEAVLGLISGMDKPGSPAGEARRHFFDGLFGRDLAFRETLRERILAVREDDLKRVAADYLHFDDSSRWSRAVVTGADNRDQCKAWGMDLTEL
ncbi:peptidase M16 [Natronospirillum operosum]|uniref:Peptidase M16 n=1 Tax=Natronospirillum operosum TaxID=2759953 RepID=A0A4Z0WCV3_9GAMM|nr:insulinase family protein [Natronospirillum operosum]TGG95684.1 peptidase M16 [Natronospirillum operosum]